MKKISLFFAALLIFAGSFAMSVPSTFAPHPLRASEIMLPVGKDGKKISLQDLSVISKKDLEKFTGRKMNFTESLAFRGAQKKLRNGISDDGMITDKKIQKMFYSDGESGFHLGGFALGFLLGLIGVLIAYLLHDDKQQNRRKWAWIGLAVSVVLSIIIVVAVI